MEELHQFCRWRWVQGALLRLQVLMGFRIRPPACVLPLQSGNGSCRQPSTACSLRRNRNKSA